jgi:hypothetical protein
MSGAEFFDRRDSFRIAQFTLDHLTYAESILNNDIMKISKEEPKTKNTLKNKASRQRLSKAELIGAVKIDEPTKPIPVFPVAPPK